MPTRMEKRQVRQQQEHGSLRIWLIELAVVVLAAVLVRTFVFSLTTVQGPSMQDTLHSGQVVAVDKLFYRIGGLQHGQVVICRYPDSEEYYIKRVIGLAGDTVELAQGVTYLNGTALAEPYVTHAPTEDFAPYTVEQGCVFVMGDNRANSHDSRAEGALAQSKIVGHVLGILFPVQQAQWLPVYEIYESSR